MVMESSQTRTAVVELPADPAQAKQHDESAKANKAREALFLGLVKDIATSYDSSHEHLDGFKRLAPLRPFAFAFDNRDVTVDR
jgi:hypothetical protein